MSAYGSTELLDEDAWMADTAEMAKTSRAVTIGMLEDEPAALVRLNVVDDSEPGVGKLGSFIIEEKYRGCGLSSQILGQAISVYRELGKDWFCTYVAVRNGRAQGFYRKNGFRNVGIHTTVCGDHFTMMKPIKVPSVQEQAADFDLSGY
ncbi:MAG: GNAT family N-acetyltransferase [Butyricicoccus sp.]|nr:GNAT family N-acetyltransferase [Butyricicoccus sp.]